MSVLVANYACVCLLYNSDIVMDNLLLVMLCRVSLFFSSFFSYSCSYSLRIHIYALPRFFSFFTLCRVSFFSFFFYSYLLRIHIYYISHRLRVLCLRAVFPIVTTCVYALIPFTYSALYFRLNNILILFNLRLIAFSLIF